MVAEVKSPVMVVVEIKMGMVAGIFEEVVEIKQEVAWLLLLMEEGHQEPQLEVIEVVLMN